MLGDAWGCLGMLRFLGSFLSKVRFFGSFLSKVGTSGLLGMRLSYWDCLRTVWVIGDAFELLGTGQFRHTTFEFLGNRVGYWGAD